MADCMRQAVERMGFQAEEREIRITIGIGAATFQEDGTEPCELIEKADRALYAAKAQGRNRVIQFRPMPSRVPRAQIG